MTRIWAAITKEQFWVLFSLAGLTLLAWLYLMHIAADMPGMMPAHPQGALLQAGVSAVMWAVMMVGMMLPSAIPMILLFAAVQRKNSTHPKLAVVVFLLGYLLVWGGFSVFAAALQTLLANTLLLSPSLALTSTWGTGLFLLVAGLYELSPLKGRCLDQCRGPVPFIASHWRPGRTGALRMGVVHGAYCLGCCWALMLLLFVGGVMSLVWVAVLAAVVLVQKVVPSKKAPPKKAAAPKAAAKASGKAAKVPAKSAGKANAPKATTKAVKPTKASAAGTSSVLTLRHLAERLSETHELPKRQANEMLTQMEEIIAKSLKKGEKIRLSGLGILQVRKRAARTGRNPQTGEPIKIKASKKIAFRPAKELKEAV